MSECITPTPETAWNHDKAETLAAILAGAPEFMSLIDQFAVEKADLAKQPTRVIAEYSEKLSQIDAHPSNNHELDELKTDALTYGLKQALAECKIAVILKEQEHRVLLRISEKTLLGPMEQLYDTDPQKFINMSREEIVDFANTVINLQTMLTVAEEELSRTQNWVDHCQTSINSGQATDTEKIEDICKKMVFSIRRVFGPNSDEAKQLVEDYKLLVDAEFESHTPANLTKAIADTTKKWRDEIVARKNQIELQLNELGSGNT